MFKTNIFGVVLFGCVAIVALNFLIISFAAGTFVNYLWATLAMFGAVCVWGCNRMGGR